MNLKELVVMNADGEATNAQLAQQAGDPEEYWTQRLGIRD